MQNLVHQPIFRCMTVEKHMIAYYVFVSMIELIENIDGLSKNSLILLKFLSINDLFLLQNIRYEDLQNLSSIGLRTFDSWIYEH